MPPLLVSDMTTAALQNISVPDDLAECQRMIDQLVGALKQALGTVGEQNERIAELQQQLQTLTRSKFGRSSESLSVGQLRLFEDPEAQKAEVELPAAEAAATSARGV